MAKVIMRAMGLDGQIALLSDRVVIQREGIVNAIKYGFNSRREIPLGAISEVAFKCATNMRFGEIEFVRSGRSTDEKKKSNDGKVRFRKSQNDDFEKLKEKAFEMMDQYARHK